MRGDAGPQAMAKTLVFHVGGKQAWAAWAVLILVV